MQTPHLRDATLISGQMGNGKEGPWLVWVKHSSTDQGGSKGLQCSSIKQLVFGLLCFTVTGG